jgi:hypothetical protein
MARLRNILRSLRIPVDVIVASEAELREWSHLSGHILALRFLALAVALKILIASHQ